MISICKKALSSLLLALSRIYLFLIRALVAFKKKEKKPIAES